MKSKMFTFTSISGYTVSLVPSTVVGFAAGSARSNRGFVFALGGLSWETKEPYEELLKFWQEL